MLPTLLAHYGASEAAALIVVRLLVRFGTQRCVALPEKSQYQIAEGVFIVSFFSYLLTQVNATLTPDLFAEEALDLRCSRFSDVGHYALRLYFASNQADYPFLLYDVWKGLRPAKDGSIMTLHHLLSSLAFWGAMYSRKMQFYAVYALLCEYTTVLVGFRRILLPFVANPRVSSFISAFDIFIMLSYFRFRVYVFFKWFHYNWEDSSCFHVAAGPFEKLLYATYIPVVGFLLLISVWWLRTMLRNSYGKLAGGAKQ
mmetsp:Transcript_150221/g.463549  ORF Transcript_150221/g.463549 Transcript_150221/m.463549 type:complete len:256 (+) Transcript_150221:56-823(+)